jgi:biotin transport system substrate-specific component
MTTLTSSLWPKTQSSLMYKALLVVAGTALLTISAKLQVPFWPVPMTLQTLVVLLIGAAYGARLGGITVAAYLVQGALGLPVFATGAGPAYLAGPTGGYLAGFLVAAIAVGWLADKGYGRTAVTTLAAFLGGEIIMYSLGVGWLSSFAGLEKAVVLGFTPFMLAEATKLALACLLLPAAWKLTRG